MECVCSIYICIQVHAGISKESVGKIAIFCAIKNH